MSEPGETQDGRKPLSTGGTRPDRRKAGKSAAALRVDRVAATAVALVAVAYLWVISAGKFTRWPVQGAYYSLLADGFAAGRLDLSARPDPKLLALPNPYDPEANAPYRLHDAVLYGDKYYLFWGPVPALLLLPYKWLAAGDADVPVGDPYLAFPFAIGTLAFGTLLLRQLWADRLADRPGWVVGAGVLGLGLALPLPYLLARPAVYEAAILGGQCFLLAGLWATTRGGAAADGRVRPRWLLAGSACWALAVGCRPSLALGVSAAAAAVVVRLLVRPAGGRPGRAAFAAAAGPVAAVAVPLLLGAAALAAYNVARFGRPLEFGQRYQLAVSNQNLPGKPLQSVRYLLPNLYSYLLRPPRVLPEFPFVEGRDGTFPAGLQLPPHYESFEPIVGLLVGAPILLLAGVPAIAALSARGSRRRRPAAGAGAATAAAPLRAGGGRAGPGPVTWTLLASFFGIAPALLNHGSTMRYLADLTPGLAVVAGLGLGHLARWVGRRPGRRWPAAAAAAGLFAYSVALSLLLGITGPYGHFRSNNPWLLRALRDLF